MNPQAAMAGVAEIAQRPRGGVVREVQAGGVLQGEQRPLGRQTLPGRPAVGGVNVLGRNAGVIPEAIGGLGRRPRRQRLRDAVSGTSRQALHELHAALVQAPVSQIQRPQFVRRPVTHTQLGDAARPDDARQVGNG